MNVTANYFPESKHNLIYMHYFIALHKSKHSKLSLLQKKDILLAILNIELLR